MNQTATIVKLFCHEVMRVFSDRIVNQDGKYSQKFFPENFIFNNYFIFIDNQMLKTTIITTIVNNFCTSYETGNENLILLNETKTEMNSSEQSSTINYFDDSIFNNSQTQTTLNTGVAIALYASDNSKSKKTVTFKAGLVDERNFVGYKGALIKKEQVSFF